MEKSPASAQIEHCLEVIDMNECCRDNFDAYVDIISGEVRNVLGNIEYKNIEKAADIIRRAQLSGRRVHISGIGKPSHIATYAASLLSSTGTPTYYLHGTEAVHGSCGQLVPGDIVIFISNSGETAEMKATVLAVKNNNCRVIGISKSDNSWLAGQSEVHLKACVENEGGPLNRAPRASVIAELIVLQALSVVLQTEVDVTPTQYVKWHPGGTLGKLRCGEV